MKRFGILAAILMLTAAAAGCNDDNGNLTAASPVYSGATTTFIVPLSTSNETPPITNAEAGMSGLATIVVRVTRDGSGAVTSATADFQVTVNGMLSNTTLVASHIHRAPAGTAGGVVVSTNMTATTNPSYAATATIAPDLAQAILTSPRDYYFNVHTTLNPGGVVRGQLAQ